jgi:predicted AAA+ superfamily ATPase
VPQFVPRIPAETLERLWIMLAHNQGQCLNASRLAGSLSISAPTVSSYIDLFFSLALNAYGQQVNIETKKVQLSRPEQS